MIHFTTNGPCRAYLSLIDNRINISSTNEQTAYLMKMTNDMDKSVSYAYPVAWGPFDRYVDLRYVWKASGTPDIYNGEVQLIPSGHYKYEIYEVTWAAEARTVADGNAPATETDVLTPPAADKGVVRGLVTKGILLVNEEAGQEQVQYTQRQEPSGTNYIYYGQ